MNCQNVVHIDGDRAHADGDLFTVIGDARNFAVDRFCVSTDAPEASVAVTTSVYAPSSNLLPLLSVPSHVNSWRPCDTSTPENVFTKLPDESRKATTQFDASADRM